MQSFPKALTHGSGVRIVLDPAYLLVALRESTPLDEVRRELAKLGATLVEASGKERDGTRTFRRVNHTRKRFWVTPSNGGAFNEESFNFLQSGLGERLHWIGPVYRMPQTKGLEGLLCPLPNSMLVRAKERASKDEQAKLASVLNEFAFRERDDKSRYLGAFRYFEAADATRRPSYEPVTRLGREGAFDVRFENMPILAPTAATPSDPMFVDQWNMTRIGAGGAGSTGWDVSTGDSSVVIAVLDEGCDLSHPDLTYSASGINLDDPTEDGSPTGPHGTACAGIAAATYDNSTGVAGVAGSCEVLPLAFEAWTDAECAMGINYAADNGALVISMSFGVYDTWGWDYTLIDPALDYAHGKGLVLCAATGNEDDGSTNRYPSKHPLVIACGASDQDDERKNPASPDGEFWWGSNYGTDTYDGQTTGVDVVAPGVLIPTTDRQGADGYNTAGGVAGDYFATFNGTSSATPQVAGLAALLLSEYPGLTNTQVRRIIESTAEKVGSTPYATDTNFASGTRNDQMGYGRINVLRALDSADIMIRDWSGDDGVEPSTPPGGNWWSYSDIVVRISDDGVFDPSDTSKSKFVERGQTNYLYIQVKNVGPEDARNVTVDARITPYVGLQFFYPTDWTTIDATHVRPAALTATFANIPAGGTEMAKFTISAAQVEDLWGWTSGHGWHPCLLARVTSDNDYGYETADTTMGNPVVPRNNFAQRNLTVIDVLAGAPAAVPMVAGHRLDEAGRLTLKIDRRRVPAEVPVRLALDVEGAELFPALDFEASPATPDDDKSMVFLERTRIRTTLGCCAGTLTLAKGSRFDCGHGKGFGKVEIRGGELLVRDGKRFVEVRQGTAEVVLEKQPGQINAVEVTLDMPAGTQAGTQYSVDVSQLDERGRAVGGASAVFRAKR